MTGLLFLIGLGEVLIGILLWGWRRDLEKADEAMKVKCYACLTKAPAEAFLEDDHLCLRHRAEWWLAHDLEARLKDG